MTSLTKKNGHRIMSMLHKFNTPTIILNLLSFIALVYPIIPLALPAAFFSVMGFIAAIIGQSASGDDFVITLVFLGGPAGVIGLASSMFKIRNIKTITLLIYGIASYFALIFPSISEFPLPGFSIFSDSLSVYDAVFFSLPPIVAIIHIGLSIRSLWIAWKTTP